MASIYTVHVGDEWVSEFQETVRSPVTVNADTPALSSDSGPARIWGATEDERGTKRTHFEEMASDDLLLFHDGDVVFATGVPGRTFDPDTEGPELGAWLWDNPESSLVFTIEEYSDDISVPLEEVWSLLGFEEDYSQMYSFKRTSGEARARLLEHFDSVAAFRETLETHELEQDEWSGSRCFILQTGGDDWADEPAERYPFVLGNPGTRQLWEAGTARIVYLEDGELYAKARVDDIERDERGDEEHLVASIDGYEEIGPVDMHDIRDDLETEFSLQHSIIEIGDDDYRTIIDSGISTRYFWVNSATEDWYQDGETAFYKRTTSSGSPRRNQPVYDGLRAGDRVVYRNEPVGAIVGTAHVEADCSGP